MKAVKPKKNLGQHFLTDLNIAKRIADTVDACPDIPVLEIGPGMGVLTQYLVEKPRPVKAVEIDSESVAYLHENFPTLKDNIIGEDFLRMDLNEIFDGKQFVLTGNYPYDISSQIFFKMLDKTGTSMDSILGKFTATGYLVTAICGVAVLILAHILLKKLAIYNKVKATLSGLWQGAICCSRICRQTM